MRDLILQEPQLRADHRRKLRQNLRIQRIGLGQALGALARFSVTTGIVPRPLKDAALRGLDAGVALRRQVIGRQTKEKNRLSRVRERRVRLTV